MSVSPDIHALGQNLKSHAAPTVDSEREEFRKFLESGGVLDVMTRIIKDLYEKDDKPADPLKFVTNALGAISFDSREIVALKDEIRSLKLVIENLEKENRFLMEKLERISSQYILAEIVSNHYRNNMKLPLKEEALHPAILRAVENLHGDYGVACIIVGFSVKMYNPATGVFILRVRRKFHSILCSTLPLMTSIGSLKRASIRTLRLTGTIRSALKFLIVYDKERLREWIHQHKIPLTKQEKLASLMEETYKKITRKKFVNVKE